GARQFEQGPRRSGTRGPRGARIEGGNGRIRNRQARSDFLPEPVDAELAGVGFRYSAGDTWATGASVATEDAMCPFGDENKRRRRGERNHEAHGAQGAFAFFNARSRRYRRPRGGVGGRVVGAGLGPGRRQGAAASPRFPFQGGAGPGPGAACLGAIEGVVAGVEVEVAVDAFAGDRRAEAVQDGVTIGSVGTRFSLDAVLAVLTVG